MKRPPEALPNVKCESGKSKTVHRTVLPNDFTILPNRLLKDKRLSFRARGILAMMLSMPEDWQTYAEWIEDQGTEGREALQSAFKELENCGYLSRRRVLDAATKKFVRNEWVWFNEPYDGFPSDGFPADGKSAATKYVQYQEQKNQESKEAKESSPNSLAHAEESFSAQWNPNRASKEQKLARIPTPTDFPSECEFDKFLHDEGLLSIINYRPDIYLQLCENKWHKWNERSMKWGRIMNWRKFIANLNDHIDDNM